MAHPDGRTEKTYTPTYGWGREYTVRFRLDTELIRSIDKVAEREFSGNRSAAVRHLIERGLTTKM